MATIRQRGKKFYFRGTIPARQADGTIRRVRHEEVLQALSRARAEKEAADLARYYWDQAYGPPKRNTVSFAKAALVYIETKGKSDRFIDRLVEHFKDTPLDEIDQAKAVEACQRLYKGWSNASLTRSVFTPLSAIGVRGLQRPKVDLRQVRIPTEDWFDRVIAASPPRLGALIIFLTLTGRRVGEAIALTEKDVDYGTSPPTVTIGRTKTGVSVVVAMPALCLDLLADRDHYYCAKGVGQPSQRLFGYASLQAAHVALRRTCERAKIPFYGFHALGRHSFATRCLKAGWSLKEVAEAGGWAGIGVVASRYLHLEQQDVQRRVEELGAEWSKRRTEPK